MTKIPLSPSQERLPLSKAILYLLEECRMVLPGIQALFGFQLTVVFNPGFAQKLDQGKQQLHFIAIALLAVAIVLIMAPAAYHRQAGPERASRHFLKLASWLLLLSMFPLAVSICIELYLVGFALNMGVWAGITAGVAAVLFALLWFILPNMVKVSRGSANLDRDLDNGMPEESD